MVGVAICTVSLAARPAMGKTTLATNRAYNVATIAKLPVLFFSLEMSKEQLVDRMLIEAVKLVECVIARFFAGDQYSNRQRLLACLALVGLFRWPVAFVVKQACLWRHTGELSTNLLKELAVGRPLLRQFVGALRTQVEIRLFAQSAHAQHVEQRREHVGQIFARNL